MLPPSPSSLTLASAVRSWVKPGSKAESCGHESVEGNIRPVLPAAAAFILSTVVTEKWNRTRYRLTFLKLQVPGFWLIQRLCKGACRKAFFLIPRALEMLTAPGRAHGKA